MSELLFEIYLYVAQYFLGLRFLGHTVYMPFYLVYLLVVKVIDILTGFLTLSENSISLFSESGCVNMLIFV